MMSPEKQALSMQKITLGLSVHRPEMIHFIADRIQQHDAIFLEEPPAADFEQTLKGVLTVDDYLKQHAIGDILKNCNRQVAPGDEHENIG